jgi:hypothetical protein
VVSIYCFHVDDALMIKVSYRAFRAYDIHYSHRFHQHTVDHRSSHDYLHVVIVREEGKGKTVVTTPGRLVYHSCVVDAYHVILDTREGTLIFLNHSLVFTLYHLV